MEGRDPWLWLLAEPAGASTCFEAFVLTATLES